MSSYPHDELGAKGLTIATYATSRDAADAIAPSVKHLQHIAMCALAALHTATVLECVAVTNHPRESLQPRYSELIRLGLVEPTGARRRNPSGKSAAVLRLTDQGRARLAGGAA
ncbi:MAG: hypothetical protein P4M15_03030 [Alphaproteobacteria bacterium]|nr:hypothetical protein [Alphaproteobacteria bacterium]